MKLKFLNSDHMRLAIVSLDKVESHEFHGKVPPKLSIYYLNN